jgi:hypothetical protein
MPKMLRPRREFPTPLFRLVAPIAVGASAALAVYFLL